MNKTINKSKKIEKKLSVPVMVGIIVVYLLIIQGTNYLLTLDLGYEYGTFPSIDALVRSVTIPVAFSVLFVVIVITWLGWWQRIVNEKIRLNYWAWIVPVLMVVSILVVTNYSLLNNVEPLMVLVLVVSVLLIGIGEELMFRGITLEVMRSVGNSTELKAALWTALIFGGVHISNIFSEGSAAFLQAAIVSVSGLFYYVAFRVSGSILVPILLHAGWDFSLFSGRLGVDPEPYTLSIIAFVTNIVLAIIIVVKWRSIWPRNKISHVSE